MAVTHIGQQGDGDVLAGDGRGKGKPQRAAKAAATQAPTDSTSCTKPRPKARSAEISSTPMTARSTKLAERPLTWSLCRRVARRVPRDGRWTPGAARSRAFLRRPPSGGINASVKPSFAASFRRWSIWPTARTSPPRPISPKTTVPAGSRTGQSRGDQRRRHRKIGRRLADSKAASDVQIYIVAAEGKAAARLQHRQHHGQPAAVPADHGAARRAGRRGGEQGLDLDQHRPGSLHAGEDRGAADLALALGEEQGRGVGDLHQPGVGHLEDADLVGRAEAVLDRPQDAELMAALAFEIEHGIDHVLEHPRAGDHALLGDMADQQQAEAAALGEPDQLGRRGPHLGHGSRRRIRDCRHTWSGWNR